jgi:hypothetical protein
MQGAEERRLRRMEQYAARRNDRRQRRRLCLDGGSGEPNGIDNNGKIYYLFTLHISFQEETTQCMQ